MGDGGPAVSKSVKSGMYEIHDSSCTQMLVACADVLRAEIKMGSSSTPSANRCLIGWQLTYWLLTTVLSALYRMSLADKISNTCSPSLSSLHTWLNASIIPRTITWLGT